MTEKEKAEKLLYDLYDKINDMETLNSMHKAKKCALIAVDEILNELEDIMNFEGSKLTIRMIKYWKEVKNNIKKL